MSIPIFIHHELNCGNIKELEENVYPLIALRQAKKYNETVIFFGNKENINWWDTTVDSEEYITSDWRRFEKNFRNLAVNYDDNYAKAFFRRLFVFYEYASQKKIDEFIMADSDVMLYENLSLDERFRDCDCAAYLYEEQDIKAGNPGNHMRWTVSLGLSYWKTSKMRDFLDFCIDMYENHVDILEKKYDFHKKYELDGGVCEMTLMYLWLQSKKDALRVVNLVKNEGHMYIVHDAGMHSGNNYFNNEYKYNEILQMKKVVFINGQPYFIRKADGKRIRVGSLHMAGGLKKYMIDFYKYNRITFKHQIILYGYWLKKKLFIKNF